MSGEGSGPPGLMVVNYDRLGDYERRIHRVRDIELPGRGVSVRLVTYSALVGVLLAVLWTLPLVGDVLRSLPMLALPVLAVAGGWAAANVKIEGLAPHQLVLAATRNALLPRQAAGWMACESLEKRWRPGEMVFLSDGSSGRVSYTGPGVVLRHVEATSTVPSVRLVDRVLRRRVPARRFVLGRERRERPQRINVPEGVSVEFTGWAGPEGVGR